MATVTCDPCLRGEHQKCWNYEVEDSQGGGAVIECECKECGWQ